MLSLSKRVALILSMILGLYIDNFSWGSKTHSIFHLSLFDISAQYSTPITVIPQAYFLWGLLWGAWIMVYLGLISIVSPKAILSPDADDSYLNGIANYAFLAGVLNALYTALQLANHLKLTLLVMIIMWYYMYQFYVFASRKSMIWYLDLCVALTLVWIAYGTCLVASIVFHLPTLVSWPLWFITMGWLIWISYVERNEQYIGVVCVWILFCILIN